MDQTSHGGGEEPQFLSTHDEGNARIMDIIRGQCEGFEDDTNFLDGELEQRLDQVDEDEISSFLNPSGDGEEEDEGQTNNDIDPSTTTGEVYRYIYKGFCNRKKICDPYIYINHSFFFFSPPDRRPRTLRELEAGTNRWIRIKGSPSIT